MERIKELDRYQKGILLLLVAMIVIFGVVYSSVSSRVGLLYHDQILQLHEDNGTAVYAGKINHQDCSFTVTADKTVTFQHGEKCYGPYTAKEDPTAIPEGKEYLTGVEILDGDAVFFRGGVGKSAGDLMLFDEAGKLVFDLVITSDKGITTDENGNILDPMVPSAATILQLMEGPELTSKGEWPAYFFGIFLSIFTAVSVLFADELFRFHLSFRVRDAYQAEPSEWEVFSRYVGWTVLAAAAFLIYITGLQ